MKTIKKYIINGPAGSGKTTKLLEIYKKLIVEDKIPSQNVLILVMNRTQSLEWRKKTILEASGVIWRTSYFGFVQAEIKRYYPIILKRCMDIGIKTLEPAFLTLETAQYLLTKIIKTRRDEEGALSDVTSYNDRIAIDLAGNLVRAAVAGISLADIGDKLYTSLEKKDVIKEKVFKDLNNVLSDYIKECFSKGVFDFGMAVELYNKYLLKDEVYINGLKNRVKHLIVDNLEECVPVAADFINIILPDLETCIMAYNSEGGYGEIFGSNHDYIKKVLIDKFEVETLTKSYTCNDDMYKFSELIYKNINSSTKTIYPEIINVEKNISQELKSDMLDSIGERIVKLIKLEGYKPCDIVLISTFADPVTEYVIERILNKNEIKLRNMARKDRIIDNAFAQALITLAILCHDSYDIIPTKDEVKHLLGMLLKLDPIRSSILAGEIIAQRPYAQFIDIEFPRLVERIGYLNVDKYENIREWITEYKKCGLELKLNEFLQKVFLELLVSDEVSENDVLQARNLIDSSQNFVETVSLINNENAGKEFVEMVRKGIKSAESIFELEEKITGYNVLISTPVAYLASGIKNKVIILIGISSENWTPKFIKELSNLHVLSKTWNDKNVYTQEMEILKQKEYLSIILRNLIKKCGEKLITFESQLNPSGFENIGMLSEYFEDILQK